MVSTTYRQRRHSLQMPIQGPEEEKQRLLKLSTISSEEVQYILS